MQCNSSTAAAAVGGHCCFAGHKGGSPFYCHAITWASFTVHIHFCRLMRAVLTCQNLLPSCCPSDVYLCQQPQTRQRMVQYAQDKNFFFSAYADGFAKLSSLGYADSALAVLA